MTILSLRNKFLWSILTFSLAIGSFPLQGCRNSNGDEAEPHKFLLSLFPSSPHLSQEANKDKSHVRKRKREDPEEGEEGKQHEEESSAKKLSLDIVLPNEVLLYIFSFLNQRDVPSVSRVSKSWQQLMNDHQLWKVYARKAKLIWKEDNSQGRDYKTLIREHSTFSLIDLGILNERGGSEVAGVSADGSVVVGYADEDTAQNQTKAFRWTKEEGMQFLSSLNGEKRSWASGVSANGSVIVGVVEDGDKHSLATAFRWTQEEGIQSLGSLNVGLSSEATGVSADGSVIVGCTYNDATPNHEKAFRWTKEEGMQFLGSLNGEKRSWATGVSADGSVIVGYAAEDAEQNPTRAFRWTQEEGMQFLGSLNGGKRSWAIGVSANGSVIVGYAAEDADEDAERNQTIAFRWTQEEGMQSLGTLEGGESYAQGVSFDGSVIVGKSVNDDSDMAFRWTREKGMESVGELLIEQGLLHPEGMLTEINAITPNGVVLVGQGEWKDQMENEENEGQIRAWRAIIPRGNLF